jgi:ADP-glucose pyrophosphorylase
VARDAVVSRSVVWSECTVGEGAFIDRCMLADGAEIEPRRSIFSMVKVARRRGGLGRQAGGQARSVWQPLVAALKPAIPHHS